VVGIFKEKDIVAGVMAKDLESGEEFEIRARGIINATGVFTDDIIHMDEPSAKKMIALSQGVHIVLDKSFLPGESAIMVPHTTDGRVLFATPWHDKVIVGTTDTPVKEALLEPRPLAEEIEFLLSHAAKYLTKDPGPSDVRSMFAGLRPLVSQGDSDNTAAISRDHTIYISRSGLVTITGGKWTTCRRMAEDTIDHAALVARLDEKPSITANLQIHGFHHHAERFGDLALYGSDASVINDLINGNPDYKTRLHPNFTTVAGEVVWAVRQEMARTVEDFLARRIRALLLDARASMEMAPDVARLMAVELNKDEAWIISQVDAYQTLARGYIL